MHRSPMLYIKIATKTGVEIHAMLVFRVDVPFIICWDAMCISCLFTGLIITPQTVACKNSPPSMSRAPCQPNVSMHTRKIDGRLKYAILEPHMHIELANERFLSKYCWITTFAASLVDAKLIPVNNDKSLPVGTSGLVLVLSCKWTR